MDDLFSTDEMLVKIMGSLRKIGDKTTQLEKDLLVVGSITQQVKELEVELDKLRLEMAEMKGQVGVLKGQTSVTVQNNGTDIGTQNVANKIKGN